MLNRTKKIGKIDSSVLSEYILFKVKGCSHLKLQKLMYYVQGYHLAYFDKPIVSDEFEAWVHGPVSRKLFNELRDLAYMYDDISYFQKEGEEHVKNIVVRDLSNEQLELIDEVLESYGKLSGQKLEALTHSEFPWKQARRGYGEAERCAEIIDRQQMAKFFKEELYGPKKK